VAAHTDRVACDLESQHFLLFYVVVYSAAVDIDDPGSICNSNDFDILVATLAPDFISKDKWSL
jgi:hypothetical protein